MNFEVYQELLNRNYKDRRIRHNINVLGKK